MGVQGIVPFLLKKCPQIIESIPNRFHALEGKTIALDGTLVTQRLHFTPDPRPHRHILGWYQLIAELRQHNIKVICVFDGKHRIPAKLNELQRRRRMRLQAQVRGAWEKARHERLLSLTEALQSLESLPEEDQNEVLGSLRDQVERAQPPGLEDEHDTILVPDPAAATIQPGDLATPAQPALGHLPESVLPVEEPMIPKLDSAPSAAISTSSIASGEISVPRQLPDAESSYVVPPNPAVDERSIVQDLPPSDDDANENTKQDEPLPEGIPPSHSTQTISPDETLPTKDEPIPNPLESHATPKVSEEPTTLRDAASSLDQPSDPTPPKDSTPESDHGGDQTTMGRDTSPVKQSIDPVPQSASLEQAKSELDLPAGVNDHQYLPKVIRHLHEHYTRTSATDTDGLIHALSEEPDAVNLPDVPISRVQLKYTQEESKLWEQLVPTSSDAKVDITRVVEQVKELASVELPQDEPEPEPEPTEQETEQAVEQQGDETAPISEWAATLEEQSGLMAASLLRRASPPTTLTYTESRLILEAMGVPCLESPMHYEAEALASSIVINGLADLVGSEDTDVLMYNAPLLRHMTNKKVPLQIIPPSTETGLGLSRSAFVDAAILMGTDFVRRLEKVGPATAYRLMGKHGSIERMLEEEPKFRPPDVADYLEQVKVARIIFSSLPPAPLPESVVQGDWDEQAVQETMAHFGLQRYMEEELIPDALSDNYFIEQSKESS